jgi:long-chain acyl-CoA synthetase
MSLTPLSSLTLLNLYNRSIENFSDRISSYTYDVSFTYKSFDQAVKKLQSELRQRDIKLGDKVALVGDNSPHWGISYFAITTMGAIVVPILPDFHNTQIRHIIRNSESKGLIFSEKKSDIFEESTRDDSFEMLQLLVNLEKLEFLSSDYHPKLTAMQKLEKAKKKSKESDTDTEVIIEEDDVAAIIYTSGTSGHSKGVMLTHKNLTSNGDATKSVVQIVPEDKFLSILPMAHTFECTIGFIMPFMYGASVFYLGKIPTPTALKKALLDVKPTCMCSVPLIIEKIFKSNIQPKLESSPVIKTLTKVPFLRKKIHKLAGQKLLDTFGGKLKFFAVGGAPLSAHVESFLIETDFPYLIGYGLTETSPLVAAANPKKRKFTSTGPTVDDVEVKLHDVNPETGEGEILVKGPNVMKGYYKNEQANEEAFIDGWFRTGDLATIDEDGYIFIKGRSKNMILGPSGENIYPEQLEAIILSFEIVLDALVFEKDGRLAAKIHLDYEKFDHTHNEHQDESQQQAEIDAILENLKVDANKLMSKFCKISTVIEQQEPFEKTPTKKIKRYLYI